MRKASVTEVKNKLSEFLQLVRRGSTVRIYDRNRPVAEIVGIRELVPGDEDLALEDLEAQGVIRRGKGSVPASIFSEKPPRLSKGNEGSVLGLLLQERKQGR